MTPRLPRREFPDPYKVEIVLDSLSPAGTRLTTWALTYPRFVHAELMTHRAFCLAGDAILEFDLPAGTTRGHRRVHKLTLADFVGKWIHGARPHRSRWGTERTYDLKPRLREMHIRQLNEATGEIETSTIVDAVESGMKPVFEIRAGKYRVAGSADHRIMTAEGWKPLGEIRVGDDIVVSTRMKPDDLKTDEMRLKKINGRWRSVWQRAQRENLFARSPTCRECNKHMPLVDLEIHHIEEVHKTPERAFDPLNVTLLCEPCHAKKHETQGWQTGVPLYAGRATVDTIRFRGVEPTYDLAIAGASPNFLANGVVVHNSRNSASSRAIPSEKMRAMIQERPALPVWWGKNQSGMQAREELSNEPLDTDLIGKYAALNCPPYSPKGIAKALWLEARDLMIEYSDKLAQLGLHKQLCNRLTEPWMPITVLVSATEFANWFYLRDHKDAQPEIAIIATEMHYQYLESKPTLLSAGGWHMPYIHMEDQQEAHALVLAQPRDGNNIPQAYVDGEIKRILRKVSVGRCARVSYLTHEGKRDLEKDVELHDRLAATASSEDPGHFSPFEHVAVALELPERIGNFTGWRQYRKDFLNEAGPGEYSRHNEK
ncbi:putative HNH endonuclease [Virus Rctr197k]|nr:putative HNH endonuclease [Virus Rctr197k]